MGIGPNGHWGKMGTRKMDTRTSEHLGKVSTRANGHFGANGYFGTNGHWGK